MTIQEIIAQAEQVRTNSVPDSNTPALVGGVIKELALAHKAIADQMQGGKLIKRIELICDDTKITRKGSDVALNYVQVKQMVDNPEFFVTLNYLGMFWMLPAYDDGGAIMFSSADVLGGHVVVTRVIMNTASELNNYSIIAEDTEHKVDDLSVETALDGHKNYPSCIGVNKALSELTARGWVKKSDIDSMTGAKDVGVYYLTSGAKSSIYGLLIVARNYVGYQTQYYIGSLDPNSQHAEGNIEWKRIYARSYFKSYSEEWSKWELIASEEFGRELHDRGKFVGYRIKSATGDYVKFKAMPTGTPSYMILSQTGDASSYVYRLEDDFTLTNLSNGEKYSIYWNHEWRPVVARRVEGKGFLLVSDVGQGYKPRVNTWNLNTKALDGLDWELEGDEPYNFPVETEHCTPYFDLEPVYVREDIPLYGASVTDGVDKEQLYKPPVAGEPTTGADADGDSGVKAP